MFSDEVFRRKKALLRAQRRPLRRHYRGCCRPRTLATLLFAVGLASFFYEELVVSLMPPLLPAPQNRGHTKLATEAGAFTRPLFSST
jgi:hypothetical protein